MFTSSGFNNKPGTAQVGFISKAQKYQGTTIGNIWKYFFQKKSIWQKKSHIAEKLKKRPFYAQKTFFTNRKLQKIQGGTLS